MLMTSLLKRPLYFDSSAILCWFFGEQGSDEMDILYKNRTNFIGRYISPIVKKEVNRRIKHEMTNPETSHTHKSILLMCKKLENFITTNPKELEKDAGNYKQKLINEYLLKKRDANDAGIISHLLYLRSYINKSKPLVVSCDKKMCKVAQGEGYKCFNPQHQKANIQNF